MSLFDDINNNAIKQTLPLRKENLNNQRWIESKLGDNT